MKDIEINSEGSGGLIDFSRAPRRFAAIDAIVPAPKLSGPPKKRTILGHFKRWLRVKFTCKQRVTDEPS